MVFLIFGWGFLGVIVNVGIDIFNVVIMKLKLDKDRKVFLEWKGKGWFVEKGKFMNEDVVLLL